MRNIKELIGDLDGRKPKEVSLAAIKELEQIDDKGIVLLARQSNDLCHKYCWANAAKVLKSIGYPRIKPVIPFLMEWFQDINWPGVEIIKDILRSVKPPELIPYIEEASKRAILDNDDLWALGIVILLNELDLTQLINGGIYKQLILLSDY